MKRFFDKFLAHQFGKPTGWFGRFYMRKALNTGNQRSNELALQHLEVRSADHVLEIGFGGGWLLQRLAAIITEGKVVGLDHSQTMVESARRSLGPLGNKIEFVCGSAEQLPFAAESFSRICTVHTLYFWKDPAQVARELFRVLQPGGLLLIGMNSKTKLETQSLTRHHFTLYEPAEVVGFLSRQGFKDITVHSYDLADWEDNHCIVAQRPL